VTTRELLSGGLPEELRLQQGLAQVLESAQLLKPDGHRGDPRTDFFEVAISFEDTVMLVKLLAARVEENNTVERPGLVRHLLITWQEYLSDISTGD